MRGNDEARRKLEAEHERPLLCRASQEDGGLGARRQGGRRRPPCDGIARNDGVMVLLGGLRLRERQDQRGHAERDRENARRTVVSAWWIS